MNENNLRSWLMENLADDSMKTLADYIAHKQRALEDVAKALDIKETKEIKKD